MHYRVTADEKSRAKTPHHIFNINIIMTHLFMSMIVLEIGDTLELLLIPVLSSIVIIYIYLTAKKKAKNDTWFVASHWMTAWKRGKILLYSYALAITMVLVYYIIDTVFPGGFSMNDFSSTGTQTNIGEVITLRFAAVVIFVAVLITFMQTGISVYDAGNGIADPKIEKLLPRDANSNEELGEGSDEVQHKTSAKKDDAQQ